MKENKIDLSAFDEIEEVEDSLDLSAFDEKIEDPRDLLKTEAVSPIAGAGIGYGLGKAAEPIATKVGEKLEEIAEETAFKAIGGETTPRGRKLLKEDISRLGLKESEFSPRKIGRQVIEQKLTPIPGIRSSTKSLEKVEKELKKGIDKTNKLLKKIETPEDLEKVYARYKELVTKDLDPSIPEDRSILKKIASEEVEFKGIRTAEELEKGKRKLQERIDFADPERTVKSKMRTAQARAFKESAEDIVEKEGGQELLSEFQELKKKTGQRGIIKDILTEGEMPQSKLMQALTGGPRGAVREALDSLTGLGALAAEKAGKVAKKAAKVVPGAGAVVGGLLGMAEGAKASEAFGQALEEEALGPLAPEVAGPKRGTLQEKLQRGDLLSPKEIKDLENQYKKNTTKKKLESGEPLTAEEQEKLIKESKSPKQEKDVQLNTITETSPEDLKNASIMAASNPEYKSYAGPLLKASEANERTRKAILFGLYQQPAFREMLKKEGK